ncbi:MAG: nitrogen regulation protein NR(II) [Terriglobales bacterium]
MAPTSNERTWLTWLVKVRVIVITFLLGIQLVVTTVTPTPISKRLFISAIGLWYTVALLYAVVLHLARETRLQACLQVLTDLGIATLVFYASGGIESPFSFLFPLLIITAAILLPRYWAYMTAALAFILSGAVLELGYFGVLQPYWVTRPGLKSLQAAIFINLFAYLTIAHLASYLVAKLRRADVELQEKAGALADLQLLHGSIIESMAGGLITTGLDGLITLVNPAAERLLGIKSSEVAGKPLAVLFREPLPEPGASRGEVKYSGPDGEEKIFGMTVCALTGHDGADSGVVYTFTDLTKIRRLEHEVRIRDRMAAIGRMASGIAHEIRNPLAAMAGSAQMLSECAGLEQDERALLDIVRRESERLNKIVTDFLAYSRGKQYVFTRTNLVAALEDTLRLLENRPECANGRIRIVRRFAEDELVADIDVDRMKQVFWNICDNALQAMPDGGVLTVTAAAKGKTVEIRFADTGKGISHKNLDNIFEPFHSEFASGTGLGLAMVYQIMQAHDAKILVQSVPEKGTEFTLVLKCAQESRPVMQATAAGGTVRG